MTNIAVVTDSTAYLPESLVEAWGIQVVPVQVIVAGRSYAEGVEISPSQVADALREWKVITTSRPAPGDFVKVYSDAAHAGADAIISIHLSSEMSGTYESALMASRESEVPIQVLDSRSVGMGLGFAVLTAAEAARQGLALEAIADLAQSVIDRAQVLFYVDTLEFLRRGGRVGAASAAVGTALRVKPLLQLSDGSVAPLEKARTANKALSRLADIAVERAGDAPVRVAVQHLAAAARAEELAEVLARRLTTGDIIVNEVGAVVGAHVGPGFVAVSLAPLV